MTRLEGIERIYELTPLQQGILFQTLYVPESSVYHIQLAFDLEGNLDERVFEEAWRSLVDRFPPLRTSFVWQRVEKPYQVVHVHADLEITHHDWRAIDAAEQEPRRRSLLEEHRNRSFDLTRPALMRLAVIVLSERRFQLVWTFHHIILEGWSAAIVLSDLWRRYTDLLAHRPSQLSPARPYAEYIGWLQRQDQAAAEAYWRERLRGFSAATRLPIDRSVETGPARVRKVDSCGLTLSKESSDALTRMSRSHRLTLNTIVQGAWSILLSRYSGQTDVVFGAVVSGRPPELPGVESTVGLFINMLPARVNVAADQRLIPWLGDLQLDQATMRQYEYSSLAQVQAWSDVPHGQPLFHTAVSFQNWMGNFPSGQVAPELHVTGIETHEASDQPLTLFVNVRDGLTLALAFDRERFQRAAIRRMLTHCRVLLEDMVARPQATLNELQLMTAAEREQVVRAWNATASAYPATVLHELIAAQAARTPAQVAVVCEEQTLTYGELERRANQLAGHLRARGVAPDVRVGLYLERSVELVVGLLAILKAGGAYLPIDPAWPPERIAFMLADADARVVLTETALQPTLPATASVVALDRIAWTGDDAPPPATDVTPAHLAYVIYTSGSTGQPKGVGIEHRNIINYVLGVAERMQFTAGMQHATVSTIAADLGNTALFPALVTGGGLHIITQERAENPVRLAEYFSRHAIDVLKIVPSHLAALLSGPQREQVLPRQRLILGGEASRRDWIEQLHAWAPSCRIYNHYGPTETTVGVLTYPVGPSLPWTRSSTLPLGRPLPNSRVYVLDAGGQPVPVGVEGELCIGGRGVARGYLNRPELTAEKFVADPFSPEPGARLYRTGDRARYLRDGSIEFCGRIDHQVKVHGYRVELGEIEAALRDQPGIRDAVVLAREDEPEMPQLVAYLVPTRPQPLWGRASVYVLPDGAPVAHLNKNETDYLYHEIFELQAYLRHGITLGDGDVIVDAGANIGLFTVFAHRLARNLRVVAFEPNPAAFACLQANAAAWGTAVQCLPVGLSTTEKTAELTFFEGMSLLSGFYADAATERAVVKTYALNQAADSPDRAPLAATLDSLLDERFQARTETAQLRPLSSVIAEQGLERIDLLKINVEKSEWDVLQGIRPDDWPKIQQLVVEVDQQAHVEPITMLLTQQGYEVLVEQDPLLRKTDLCYVYAIRPSADRRLLRDQPPEAHRRALSVSAADIVTPTTLRTALQARLPQYMIPTFILLDRFPLTANGKLDRHALPAPSERLKVVRQFVAPRDPLEQLLAQIWVKVLRVKHVGVHDNFFDLGGHSLLAVRVMAQVERHCHTRLPLAVLLQTPTIAGMAEILRSKQWTPSWSSLVPIRPGGSKPPLFLLHAHGGNVLEYYPLAHHLESDQPVYALQARGLNGHIVKNPSIEGMASAYLDEIRSLVPDGPYFLAGFCFGGYLALEAARQLSAAGQEVAFLLLIQSIHPQAFRFKPTVATFQRYWHRTTKRIDLELENLSHGGIRYAVTRSQRLRDRYLAKTAIAFENLTGRTRSDPSRLSMRYILESLAIEHGKAAMRYAPAPYNGEVVLFRASKQLSGLVADEDLGWKSVLRGNLDICEVPGHQQNLMVEPNVARLAEELTIRLSAAQRRYKAADLRPPSLPGTPDLMIPMSA